LWKIFGENIWGKYLSKIFGENICGKYLTPFFQIFSKMPFGFPTLIALYESNKHAVKNLGTSPSVKRRNKQLG